MGFILGPNVLVFIALADVLLSTEVPLKWPTTYTYSYHGERTTYFPVGNSVSPIGKIMVRDAESGRLLKQRPPKVWEKKGNYFELIVHKSGNTYHKVYILLISFKYVEYFWNILH